MCSEHHAPNNDPVGKCKLTNFGKLKHINLMPEGNQVQAKNPRTGRWVRINRKTGRVYSKKSDGRWKGIPEVVKIFASNGKTIKRTGKEVAGTRGSAHNDAG